MNKFLQEVANFFFQNYGNELVEYKIVFPNRRAGLFFQKYLSELIDKPVFSPKILTISEVVSEFSQLQLVEQNKLIVELYKVYSNCTKSSDSLDEFYYWGEMMLTDFNDIDKYLVDAKQLFSNIQSLHEIDNGFDFLSEEQIKYLSTFWTAILSARNSNDKKQFLSIWEKLYQIYTQFSLQLESKNLAYEGLMYRRMAENLSNEINIEKSERFAFVGFNALNKCEKKLFNHLKINNQALFFWDYDSYYFGNRTLEAGLFIEENLQLFPMPSTFNCSFDNFSSLKNIDLVSVPGFSGQATFAANWIEQNSETVTTKFDNTALVLCDETLLLPMLNTIPEKIQELNITMGFPIKSSPAYALVKGLIDIDKNSRKGKEGFPVFYFRNVLGLLNNSLIKNSLDSKVDLLVEKIKKENKIYLSAIDFENHDFLKLLFDLPNEAIQCKEYLHQVLRFVFSTQPNEDDLLKESLYQLYLVINRLHDSLFSDDEKIGVIFSKKLYYQLLLRQLDRLSIPFEGEPLSGMQLMGFLETRCLDFDNLILLSFNDDKLPGKSHNHSFIPYSLRKGFGLPVVEQRNAMYSYYFYRLIQRAKNVTLVYDSRSDGMSGGEISRFATQLKYEANHLKISEKQGVFNFAPTKNKTISVQKTDEVMVELKQHFYDKRISPSSLNIYLDCQLKFFLKYIEKINEADDFSEDIDHLVFGNIAHKTLEFLYKPFINLEISSSNIQDLLEDKKRLNQCLSDALRVEYIKEGSYELNGKNLLVYDVIKKYVIRILKYDATIAPFKLISIEKEYENTMNVSVNGKEVSVRFGGTVDRLDLVGDTIRVVDYKTGVAKNKVLSMEKLFVSNDRNKAAFQTLLYANCVNANMEGNLPIMPAVYGARSVFASDFDPAFQINNGKLIYQANAEEFDTNLKQLFEEILDHKVPFSQCESDQNCRFCEFNGICLR